MGGTYVELRSTRSKSLRPSVVRPWTPWIPASTICYITSSCAKSSVRKARSKSPYLPLRAAPNIR